MQISQIHICLDPFIHYVVLYNSYILIEFLRGIFRSTESYSSQGNMKWTQGRHIQYPLWQLSTAYHVHLIWSYFVLMNIDQNHVFHLRRCFGSFNSFIITKWRSRCRYSYSIIVFQHLCTCVAVYWKKIGCNFQNCQYFSVF